MKRHKPSFKFAKREKVYKPKEKVREDIQYVQVTTGIPGKL